MNILTMPKWFEQYLINLSEDQKADLGCWILQNSNDNDLTTEIIAVIDPGN